MLVTSSERHEDGLTFFKNLCEHSEYEVMLGDEVLKGIGNIRQLLKRGIVYIPDNSQFHLFEGKSMGFNVHALYEGGLFSRVNRKIDSFKEHDFCNLCGIKADPDREIGELSTIVRKMMSVHRFVNPDIRLLLLDAPLVRMNERDALELRKYLKKIQVRRGIPVVVLCRTMYEVRELCDVWISFSDRKIQKIISVERKEI